ncbi:hypothetical protein DL96DRAFT_543543 [Flagelloscypha sp. PMI_526]|nr:hypothetical protein DL96DRAFT_543543 [Flagelloscypha sp. PMI_526]
MPPFSNMPDELLEHIFFFCCHDDFTGLVAQRMYSVCKRWNLIISPNLYRHLAVLPPTIPYCRGLFQSLLESLEHFEGSLKIESLLVRVFPQHANEIFKSLTRLSSTTLVSLTIWLRGSLFSVHNFLCSNNLTWPVLTHLTIVGDTSDSRAQDLSLGFRLPSLTHIHIIGNCSWPSFGKASDLPKLCHFRVSMIRSFHRHDPVLGYLHRALYEEKRDWAAQIKVWEMFHEPGMVYRSETLEIPLIGGPRSSSRPFQHNRKLQLEAIDTAISRLPGPPTVNFVPMENIPSDIWKMRTGSNQMWERVLGLLDWE